MRCHRRAPPPRQIYNFTFLVKNAHIRAEPRTFRNCAWRGVSGQLVGAEMETVRELRRHYKTDAALERHELHAVAYWRYGKTVPQPTE
jgi:hypothetical protein